MPCFWAYALFLGSGAAEMDIKVAAGTAALRFADANIPSRRVIDDPDLVLFF
jgi:hypothetical protein